jgi:carbamate kinase
LLVVALGGNALAAPDGRSDLGPEREAVARAVEELAPLARSGARLLVVHGNGPQVGRLLHAVGDVRHLDVAAAQSQGELGYLLVEALDDRLGDGSALAVLTRVGVDPDDPAFEHPSKPVGPVLPRPALELACAPTPDGRGWRRVVASPRPRAVLEEEALRALLLRHHVVAGGGGGVAVTRDGGARRAPPAVVDKDWTAALLARRLGAEGLLFVTDVPSVFEGFARRAQRALPRLDAAEARRRLAAGEFAPGSMGPKVEAAIEFVEARRRAAWITGLGAVAAVLRGEAGTRIEP